MGHIADVVANTPITSAWGNAIRDHATMVYDSAAQRTAQWIAPPVGAMSYLVDQPGKLWVYEAGAWQVLVDRNHGTAVIAEQTLAIDGTISILAIPQTYTHLRLTVSGRGAAAVNLSTVLLRINGDAAANYDTLYLTGVGGGSPSAQSAQVLAGTTMGVGAALGNTGTAGRGFATEILLFDYRGGTYQKDVRAISNVLDAAFTGRAQQESGHWRSAAAITQLDLHHNVVGTGWKAGTRWTLEGIR